MVGASNIQQKPPLLAFSASSGLLVFTGEVSRRPYGAFTCRVAETAEPVYPP